MANQRKKGLAQANVWVPVEVKDWLQSLADEKGVFVSDVLKDLLDREMKRDLAKKRRSNGAAER